MFSKHDVAQRMCIKLQRLLKKGVSSINLNKN
jgi:hypothetical protein